MSPFLCPYFNGFCVVMSFMSPLVPTPAAVTTQGSGAGSRGWPSPPTTGGFPRCSVLQLRHCCTTLVFTFAICRCGAEAARPPARCPGRCSCRCGCGGGAADTLTAAAAASWQTPSSSPPRTASGQIHLKLLQVLSEIIEMLITIFDRILKKKIFQIFRNG